MQEKTESLTFRQLRAGDESGILDLFRAAGCPHDSRFWKWFNMQNPYGSTFARVAVRDGKILGHYSVLPRKVYVGSRPLMAGLAVHAAVMPGERNLNTILRLCHEVYEDCRKAGMAFVYGFPNDRIWLVKTRLLDWKSVSDFTWLSVPISDLRERFPDRDGANIRVITKFNENHVQIWVHLIKDYIICDRSAEFLNWRFQDHPEITYQMYEDSDQIGSLSGYIVLKVYQREEKRYGHIVDVGTDPSQMEKVLKQLFGISVLWFESNDVDVVSCWMFPGSPYHGWLEEHGFREAGLTTHFGCKILQEDVGTLVLERSRWYVAMGDSDAF